MEQSTGDTDAKIPVKVQVKVLFRSLRQQKKMISRQLISRFHKTPFLQLFTEVRCTGDVDPKVRSKVRYKVRSKVHHKVLPEKDQHGAGLNFLHSFHIQF